MRVEGWMLKAGMKALKDTFHLMRNEERENALK